MLLALEDRLTGGPDWQSREARSVIVLAVALLHALLFALLIATRPDWRKDASLPDLTVELVRAPADQDVDAAPSAEPPAAESEQSGQAPSIPIPGPSKPIGPAHQPRKPAGQAASPALPGPPAHCRNAPATLADPLALPPCDLTPLDERAQKALGDLINPRDRTGLAKEAEKATSNAAHFELFTILNDRFRPTPPSEDRSLQSRSEALLGAPGKDISVFAPEPSVFDRNPH